MKIIHDQEAKQINFLDERFYTIDGKDFFPSVTTILDVYPKGYGFVQWLKDLGNNADEVLRRAGEQGSKVHEAIDMYLKGVKVSWTNIEGNPYYSIEEWKMILRFVEFWETHKPTLISNESSLCSEKLGFGGTIDIVCEIKGEIWLIDTKTSNAIHTSHELQIAAYSVMWNLLNEDRQIERTGIMWLKSATRAEDKTGKKVQGKGWVLKEFDRHYQDAYKIFQHTHAIWREENPNYKPKNMILPDHIKL